MFGPLSFPYSTVGTQPSPPLMFTNIAATLEVHQATSPLVYIILRFLSLFRHLYFFNRARRDFVPYLCSMRSRTMFGALSLPYSPLCTEPSPPLKSPTSPPPLKLTNIAAGVYISSFPVALPAPLSFQSRTVRSLSLTTFNRLP